MILCEIYNIEEWEERENRVSVADLPCWIFPWEPQSTHSWAGQKKRKRKLRARRAEVSGSALFLETKWSSDHVFPKIHSYCWVQQQECKTL